MKALELKHKVALQQLSADPAAMRMVNQIKKSMITNQEKLAIGMDAKKSMAQEQQEITENIKSYLSRADQFAVRMSAIVGVSHAAKGKSLAGRGTVEQEALFVDKNNINLTNTNVPEQEDISVAAPK